MEKDKRPHCGDFDRPEHRDEVGFQINSLSRMIGWKVHEYEREEGERFGTGMHGWLVGFLYENRDKDIYQRDLQQYFSVRRSTMTGILQAMEKEGMITRKPVDWDARLKKIELTDKAVQRQQKMHENIEAIEAQLSSGLTAEEQETFIQLCEKIRKAIE